MGHSHPHLKYARNYFWKDVFTLTPVRSPSVAHMTGTYHGHANWVSYSSAFTNAEINNTVLIIFRAIAAINKDFSYKQDLNNSLLAWPSFRSRKKIALLVEARREIVFSKNRRKWQWLDARLCTKVMCAQTFSFLSTSPIIFCWQEAHSCQDSGPEMASPMVILLENLVVFYIFSLTFTFFSTLEYTSTDFWIFCTLSVPSWRLCLLLVWCCSVPTAQKCLVYQ